jgi:alginate lyase
VAGEPQLEWGRLVAFDLARAAQMPADLVRAWQVAQQSLGLVVRPIERFELAGTLNGHPGHIRSDEAKRPFGAIFALAVASRTAAEPLRGDSLRTAVAALLAWAQTYRPEGNPIDEWFFIPLLQAADLIAPGLDPADRRTVLDWVAEFAVAGDAFFAAKGDRNTARANNWMARRLLIRAVAATVAGLTSLRAELPGQLSEFTARNYVVGPSGRPDGRTYDFGQRDALHYHIAAVQPLVEIALYGPDLVEGAARAAVLSGLDFLRPYFLRQATHTEFAATTNSFDLARRADGNPVFQPEPWDPDHGRVLLRLARPAFPEIRAWTEDIVDARYDPRTKLLAAIYGEPQRRAQWP